MQLRVPLACRETASLSMGVSFPWGLESEMAGLEQMKEFLLIRS